MREARREIVNWLIKGHAKGKRSKGRREMVEGLVKLGL